NLLNSREMFPSPRSQPCKPAFDSFGLPGLVILAANNQQILRFTIRTYPLKPHIMERVYGIPVKRLGDRTWWYECTDHISSIGLLFGIHLEAVIDCCVCCDDRGSGGNNRASFRSYRDRFTAFYFSRLRFAEQLTVQSSDRSATTRPSCQPAHYTPHSLTRLI